MRGDFVFFIIDGTIMLHIANRNITINWWNHFSIVSIFVLLIVFSLIFIQIRIFFIVVDFYKEMIKFQYRISNILWVYFQSFHSSSSGISWDESSVAWTLHLVYISVKLKNCWYRLLHFFCRTKAETNRKNSDQMWFLRLFLMRLWYLSRQNTRECPEILL